MVNNRIFYAAHQVSIADNDNGFTFATSEAVNGVQSVGITTNFNLEQLFQLGMLGLYENIEWIPDV